MAAESLDKWISCIYRHGQIFIAKELEKFGIGSGQHMFIQELCDNPGVSQDKIAQVLAMNKGTVARALKQLEADGYALREANEADKRANRVFPTQKALDIQAAIEAVTAEWDAQVTANMNGSEKMLLKSMMRRACENAIVAVKPQYARQARKSRFHFNSASD